MHAFDHRVPTVAIEDDGRIEDRKQTFRILPDIEGNGREKLRENKEWKILANPRNDKKRDRYMDGSENPKSI